MTKVDDGGPAFPGQIRREGWNNVADFGMSLRDYFAAAALTSVYADSHYGSKSVDEFIRDVAARSYIVADAMLAARKREG